MANSAYLHIDFWLLILFSIIVPIAAFVYVIKIRRISRLVTLIMALSLLIMAGIDAFLLQKLYVLAKISLLKTDDFVFASEISFSLYLLPIISGGLGLELLTQLLTRHLIIKGCE